MEYLIGVAIAAGVCVFALLSGLDRGRVFYATLVLVVAHYYILFAVLGNSSSALLIESCAATAFIAVAVLGFQKNPWLIAVGLTGHGVFDFFHQSLIRNPGVPPWWPGFCLSFDILAGALFALLLMRHPKRFER